MKVGFFLQRRFAYVGHEVAKLLKERHGIEEFCGYVGTRSSLEFLQKQNDIKYTSLVLDDDIYAKYKNEKVDPEFLAKLEKEYGPTLWKYIYLDRVIRYNLLVREYPYDTPRYTHEEMLRIVQVAAKEVAHFLDTQKPDVLFFSVVSHLGSYLLYAMAKKRGIRTFLLDVARIGNKYFLTEDYERSTFVADALKAKSISHEEKDAAKKFLVEFQNRSTYYLESSQAIDSFKKPTSRLSGLSFLSPGRLWRVFFWLGKSSANYVRYSDDYVTQNPFWSVVDKIKRKTRALRGYSDLYEPVRDESYVYLPLHTEPEAYPMLLAPYYTDQLWLVRQVARSIPVSQKLYVKDHPGMIGFRTRAFYRELKKIPNVRLIDVRHNSLDLIKKSRLVVTLVGTAGWEAALSKKPAIVFGPIFYDCLSAVKRCVAIEDLPDIVHDQLENHRYEEDELVNLVAALYKESVELDLVHLWDVEGGINVEKRRNELVPLADLIASKLKLKKTA